MHNFLISVNSFEDIKEPMSAVWLRIICIYKLSTTKENMELPVTMQKSRPCPRLID